MQVYGNILFSKEMTIHSILHSLNIQIPVNTISVYFRREGPKGNTVKGAILYYSYNIPMKLSETDGEKIFNHLSTLKKQEISKWSYSLPNSKESYEYAVFTFCNNIVAFLQRYSDTRIDYILISKEDIRKSMSQYEDRILLSDHISLYRNDPELDAKLRWIHNT